MVEVMSLLKRHICFVLLKSVQSVETAYSAETSIVSTLRVNERPRFVEYQSYEA